jgi:hypothetical protein
MFEDPKAASLALAAVVALIAFLCLRPKVKALIALIIMTSCFDLVPRIIGGIDTWDIGAVLLILTGGDLLLRFGLRKYSSDTPPFMLAFMAFYAWVVVCFICSLLIYNYPLLPTVKFGRQMVLGYLSLFIFARLFAADRGSLKFMLSWLYRITFVLMIAALAQRVLPVHLLAGAYREYGGTTRYLPSFMSFCLLFYWQICANLLSGERLKLHEMAYTAAVLGVVLTSYTRGIYAAVILGMTIISLSLLAARQIKATAVVKLSLVGAVALITFYAAGGLDLALKRFGSAVDITLGQAEERKGMDDTFTGRLQIVGERAAMVASHNPLMGYGFWHDELVPPEVLHGLKYGSIIYTDEYVKRYVYGYPYVKGLHSADAGWADMILNTGFLGVALFLVAILMLIASQFRAPEAERAREKYLRHLRVALFTEILLLVVLMVEGNPFVVSVQMAGFMIAAYSSLLGKRREGSVAATTRLATA